MPRNIEGGPNESELQEHRGEFEGKMKELESPEVLKDEQQVVQRAAELYHLSDEKDLTRVSRAVYLSLVERDDHLTDPQKEFFRELIDSVLESGIVFDDFQEKLMQEGKSSGEAWKEYNESPLPQTGENRRNQIKLNYLRTLGFDQYLLQEKIPNLVGELQSEGVQNSDKEDILKNVFDASIVSIGESWGSFFNYLVKTRGITKDEATALLKPRLNSAGIKQKIVETRTDIMQMRLLSHVVSNSLLQYAMPMDTPTKINYFNSFQTDIWVPYLRSLGVPTNLEELNEFINDEDNSKKEK